ncbi:MAG: hypothetical protein R3A11_04440 [Bdellovibrionota bacterium]
MKQSVSRRMWMTSFVGILFFGMAHAEQASVVASFDIGSGSTKMVVSKVDCSNASTITVGNIHQRVCDISVLDEGSAKHSWKNAVRKDSKGYYFDEAELAKGLAVLKKLLDQAKKQNPVRFEAAATSAWRTVSEHPNEKGKSAIAAMKDILGEGSSFQIISAEKEAWLGAISAIKVANVLPKNVLVQDIGGGSQQITVFDSEGNMKLWLGKDYVASEKFTQWVSAQKESRIFEKYPELASGSAMASKKGLHPKTVKKLGWIESGNPNPIGRLEIIEAQAGAEIFVSHAMGKNEKGQSVTLQEAFSDLNLSQYNVVGIGGVLYYSVLPQVQKQMKWNSDVMSFDKIEIEQTLQGLLGYTGLQWDEDKHIWKVEDYSQNVLPNVVLVNAMMDELRLDAYTSIEKVNMAHAQAYLN